MLDVLDRKIRQMHHALGSLENPNLSQITTECGETERRFYRSVDFNQGQSDAQLFNTACLLTANIASLKDHLKAWCAQHGVPFTGDQLIDSDQDVATIHDLWNIDKHAELNRPPRSGRTPRLTDLRQGLRLSTRPSPNSSTVLSMEPRTGKHSVQTTGGGGASLFINARVVDENGDLIGDFAAVCERAAAAWERTLTNAGVPVPQRLPREPRVAPR